MRTEVPPTLLESLTGSPGRHAYLLAAKAHAPRPLWEVWLSGGVLCRLQFMQRDRRQVKKPVDTRALSADPHFVAAMTRPVAAPKQALHPELPGCPPPRKARSILFNSWQEQT